MSGAQKNERPVYMAVDKPLLGYIATVTGLSISEVTCTIRDMAQFPLDRMYKKNLGHAHNKKLKFPNSNILLRIDCEKTHNKHLLAQHQENIIKRFREQTGYAGKSHWGSQEWDNWYARSGYEWYRSFPCILITAELVNEDVVLNLSEDDIAAIAVESILLLPNEDTDDGDANTTGEGDS